MATPDLARKLRLLPGTRALILNAPAGYEALLDPLPEGVSAHHVADGQYDFVQLFVTNSGEFNALIEAAKEAVSYDGLFWISYPKKSSRIKSDLSRDTLWEMMADSGLRPVTQISIDETWSALRFRPVEKVGK